MTSRATHGEGSVYQRKDGRWVGAKDVGWTRAGKRRRVTVVADTEHQARVRLRDRIRALEDDGGGGVDPRATVKAWSDEWLGIVERTLRPHSYTATRSAVRVWIVPTIGRRRLSELTPGDVRAVSDAMRREGRKESSQRRVRSVLDRMLADARAEGHAVPARVLEVKAPAPNASDRSAMGVEQAVAVLKEAARTPHASRWVAALLQGMRQGEALGLTWDQVDLDRGALVLSWQLQPLPYRVTRDRASGFRTPDGYEATQLDGRLHLVRPKSRAGWRVIPLVPWMVTALEKWQKVAPDNPYGLVWPRLDGKPVRTKDDDAEWYGLQDAAKVKHPTRKRFTVHEARHTTATLLLEAGVSPEVITQIMGHSSWATTRGYLHADTTRLVSALEKVAERLALSQPSE